MELPSAQYPQNFSLNKFLLFFHKKTCSEKISYIFSKERLTYISENETLHFSAQAQKIKKSIPRRFLNWETKTPKKFLIFSRKKTFLMFRKTEAPKKFLISQAILKNFLRPKSKKETSYISGGNLKSLKIKNILYFFYKEAKFSKLKLFDNYNIAFFFIL